MISWTRLAISVDGERIFSGSDDLAVRMGHGDRAMRWGATSRSRRFDELGSYKWGWTEDSVEIY